MFKCFPKFLANRFSKVSLSLAPFQFVELMQNLLLPIHLLFKLILRFTVFCGNSLYCFY